ncbi:MAG TPA: CTQ-dependent lysine 6-oxidase LodA [Thermoanaerobaculia bacterium]
MATHYSIHPAIGVAREGNSPVEYYLAPTAIGALPTECDERGNPILEGGAPRPVTRFKDALGRIKRQAAVFHLFRRDDAVPDDPGVEVTLADAGVEKIEWTVHLANKKAAWYQFSELEGDLLLGHATPDGGNSNSYQARQVPLRNAGVVGDAARQKLIIDPGPRRLDGPRQEAEFSRGTIPPDYPHGSFPPPDPSQGDTIDTLGGLRTDDAGRLLVLGGFGKAGGDQPIDSFGGADSWHDDISDGPVGCRLHLKGGEVVELDAWVIVGSPKFAPELVNVVSLDDVAFDVGVRSFDLVPDLCRGGKFNRDYVVPYERDLLPILTRPIDNIWVANVQSMAAFSNPPFDTRDASEANRPNREAYFTYFRAPSDDGRLWSQGGAAGIPLMPLNSGSNSVSNTVLDKFLTLTETQYFLLSQWAAGKFSVGVKVAPLPGVDPLDRACLGNCVGGPLCPGIEVTWSTRNPEIYERPYHIAVRQADYAKTGLSPSRDECEGGGCEPGDLTKRMAIPWQADFFQCTIQFINFTDPSVNKVGGIPEPPTYYAYWWPPQSPMYVLSGGTSVAEQAAAGVPAGYQVYFPRGINSFAQMITGWSYLGFVVNQNGGPLGRALPYFVEKERNHERFAVASVAVGDVSNFDNPEDTTFWPVWYLKPDVAADATAAKAQAAALPGVPPAHRVRMPRRGNRH